MTTSLHSASSSLAIELYKLLHSVDPARWRGDLEESAWVRLDQIRQRVNTIVDACEVPNEDSQRARLYQKVTAIGSAIEKYRPMAASAKTASSKQISSKQAREEWRRFQLKMQPMYASLASCLQHLSTPVPALRPTNYGRNLFHFLSGVGVMLLIQYLLNPTWMIIVAGGFAVWCWIMEALRIRFPFVTKAYMSVLGKFAHPHEHHRTNSATWFSSALAVLALGFSPMVCIIAVAVLCVGDPMAALVGRRFGKHQLRAGRTIEGSLGFVVAGTLASLGVTALWYPTVALPVALLVAFLASVGGAVAELFSDRIDDNFTIPIGSATAAALTLLAFGL